MIWVIDCSFYSALFLPDESSSKVRNFFLNLTKNDELWVPSLWWYEIINVLIVSERRKRLVYSDVIKIFSLLEKLELVTDTLKDTFFSKEIYELAQRYQLSAYDAAYLELAIRKGASLASLDKQLIKAASSSGINVYKK